jgi:hypothetical protein
MCFHFRLSSSKQSRVYLPEAPFPKLIYLPQHEGMELQGDKHEIVLKMIT